MLSRDGGDVACESKSGAGGQSDLDRVRVFRVGQRPGRSVLGDRGSRCLLHRFEKGTSSRIRNQRVNDDTGDEVDYADIAKGAEVSDGEYVVLPQEELESVEPGRSRAIEISDFVKAGEIDPICYQKSYYLAPSDDSAKRAYGLLVRAMDKAERVGIATFMMRGKQDLAAIRPSGNVLVLETMCVANEVCDPLHELDTASDPEGETDAEYPE
jgi:Ku protein